MRSRPVLAAVGLVLALGATGFFLQTWLDKPFSPVDTPVGALLGPGLTHFVSRVNHAESRQVALDEAAPTARAAELLGPPLTAHYHGLLHRAAELAASPAGQNEEAFDRLQLAATAFDKGCLGRGQPYFVDVEGLTRADGGPLVLLLSFYVQRERTHLVDGREIRAVRLWRLDRLSVDQGYLGYTRPHTPAALVLLDAMEEDLVLRVMPALPEGEPLMLVDEDVYRQKKPWEVRLRAEAAAAMRRYKREAFQNASPELERVGQLLAERRKLVESWDETVRHLRLPRRLIPEADYVADLKHLVPSSQRYRWDEIHDELSSGPVLQAFEMFRDNYVVGVERHEVQHRIDYQGEFSAYPELLGAVLGLENPNDVLPDSMPARVRDELSAHLAEIAQAPGSPLLDLLLFARHLFSSSGPYSVAAYAAFPWIAEELGMDAELRPRSPARAAELLLGILKHPSPAIVAAVERTYERIYGHPIPQTRVVRDQTNPLWRH